MPRTGSEEEGRPGRLEFERGSEAAMAAEEEGEGMGGGVGWSGGAREGEREVGDERRLGGGLIRARPGGAVGGAHGHGPWRCQRPKGRSGACLGCSWSWSRPRGEERGSRASSRRSRTSAATGGRERRSGTHVRGRRREKEEGADRLACPGRRGGLGGHKGKALGGQKPRAGRGYSALVHCSALQSMHMAGIGIFLAPRAWPLVSRGSGEE